MSNEFLGWFGLVVAGVSFVGARIRPIGRHSQRTFHAVGAGIGLLSMARLVEPSGSVLLGIEIVAAGLLLAAIVSFALSVKRREALRGREPS